LSSYSEWFKPGDEIHFNGTTKVRVLDLIDVSDEDSPYDGLLRVEAV